MYEISEENQLVAYHHTHPKQSSLRYVVTLNFKNEKCAQIARVEINSLGYDTHRKSSVSL